MPGFPIQ